MDLAGEQVTPIQKGTKETRQQQRYGDVMRLHEAAPKLIIQERLGDKVKVSSYWPVPELTRAELALGQLHISPHGTQTTSPRTWSSRNYLNSTITNLRSHSLVDHPRQVTSFVISYKRTLLSMGKLLTSLPMMNMTHPLSNTCRDRNIGANGLPRCTW